MSRGRVYGLFVGIDEYKELPERKYLEGAANDAERVSRAVAPALTEEPIVLTNKKAKRRDILGYIEGILRACRPGDFFLFFCACHGQSEYGEFFLWPHDHDRRRFLATALLFRDVANAMAKPDVDTLTIIDACQAGAIGFDPSDYSEGTRSNIMAASGPLESSKERPWKSGGPKFGVFAYGLSRELDELFAEDGPGEATITQIFRGAYDFTKENAFNEQHPIMVGTLPADLLITRASSN